MIAIRQASNHDIRESFSGQAGGQRSTFRLRDGCSASIWSSPDGSGLLTLDGSSV
jgi:hypothetical protein